jgi:hypothetical protein
MVEHIHKKTMSDAIGIEIGQRPGFIDTNSHGAVGSGFGWCINGMRAGRKEEGSQDCHHNGENATVTGDSAKKG